MAQGERVNPLVEVQKFGHSIWYDNIRRSILTSGQLRRMIEQDGILGLTSNPSIFKNAIAGSADYDAAIETLVNQGKRPGEIYEALVIEDIRMAADLLAPVHQRTQGRDGYVSVEVSPYLADDTEGTVREAVRLRREIGRENVMIKVPATPAGLAAAERLITEAIHIDITLIFSIETYEKAVDAYMAGIEARLKKGQDAGAVAAVTSFFVSRFDTEIDRRLDGMIAKTKSEPERKKLTVLVGRTSIACARMAYRSFRQALVSDRWKKLEKKGARVPRLIWASSSTKNPKYSDVLYVEELIGSDTISTVPGDTLNAFRDHGHAALTADRDAEQALVHLDTLARAGIRMADVSVQLQEEGLRAFYDACDELMCAVELKRETLLGRRLNRQTWSLGPDGVDAVAVRLAFETMRRSGFVRRLWAKDPTLWTAKPEHHPIITGMMGWLHITATMKDRVEILKTFAADIRSRGINHVVLLGMGGSSLCPEVLRMTFGVIKGSPELHVLDSTVPAQVLALERRVDLSRTLFIVASKSGSTVEPNSFYSYFFEKMRAVKKARVAQHFVAITDPGSSMEKEAMDREFAHIFFGVPDIGGRFSALSKFGLVPAAVMGVDVGEFLSAAEIMVKSCGSCVPPECNPGVALGTVLGEMANKGRDKVTIVTSPCIGDLGAWLEQLVAESSGKEGKGIVPVADESLGLPSIYGDDRVFVYIRVASAADAGQDRAVDALEKAGFPVVRIEMDSTIQLGQEFFRWEIATATACAVMGVDAFDQPNVQESKDNTKALLGEYKKTGSLPKEEPFLSADGISFFADATNAAALKNPPAKTKYPRGSVESVIHAHLSRLKPDDYAAFNAYIEMDPANVQTLRAVRAVVRDAKKVATTVGFGPRFLHSTGQLHKGGADNGVFTQITSDDAEDIQVPGEPFTFGVLKSAQATGDLQALSSRGRRLLRVHLGKDVPAGLARLLKAMTVVLNA